MKNIALTIVLSFVGIIAFSQNTKNFEPVKYVTTAPDGSVSMTIIDDFDEGIMKLQSADAFYKYQILDTRTSEIIYASINKGKECHIDKSKIASGTYNIRLYTSNFIITSKITISAFRKFNTSIKEANMAMND